MNTKVLSISSRSLTIELVNDSKYFIGETLTVLVNGEEYKNIEKNVFTLNNLEPATQYEIKICRGDVVLAEEKVTTEKEYVTLNVKKFGAKGDGVSDDTHMIQAAILSCPDFGRVYVPAGVYRVTALFLRSNITLEISKDAVIKGLPEREKYPILPGFIDTTDEKDEYYLGSWEGNPLDSFASIITGVNVENVKIIGEGTLDGGASKEDWWHDPKKRRVAWRPRMLFLNKCKNITVEGIKITNSPSWTVHPFFSENLNFLNLKIENPSDSPNTDGIDPESCNGVNIIGVDFSVGDDCIAIKSGKLYMGQKLKTPSQNFNIRNCSMKYGHGGVVLGSEMSGGTNNIMIEKCQFLETDKGLRIKTRRGRGKDGVLASITVKDVDMKKVKIPFVVNCYYFCDPDGKTEYVYTKEALPLDDRIPEIKNMVFENIKCEEAEIAAGFIYGLPEKKVENLTFKNIYIDFAENCVPDTPAMMSFIEKETKGGFFIANAKNITFENVEVEGYIGEKIRLLNSENIEFRGENN